ncbi:hypothetical protein [Arachidicoccus sp.]|uniref:hypothetical protein n=1 Tax=Arachidicoccus sp. TaxID=1872624 RepID=UPI003D252262
MTIERIYKIITAIILPITYLLAFFTLPVVLMSLGNPSSLIGSFIFVCVLIYSFKSIIFFRKNILLGAPAKANTKDWIRINGFISFIFIVEIIASTVTVFVRPAEVMTVINKMVDSFTQQSSTKVSGRDIYNMLKGLLVFFSVYSLILLVHIIISFKFLKKYRNLLSM